jgi:hypothetical protein
MLLKPGDKGRNVLVYFYPNANTASAPMEVA